MSVRHIKQAVTTDSLFTVLSQWCKEGAGHTAWTLRVMSAFVSGSAVRAMEPLLDVFLADGNAVEIIFGIDRGGTDRSAVQNLHALGSAYPGQVVSHLFQAPSNSSIFHPKLYILNRDKTCAGVIGSANLTLSGLGSNLESLLLCDQCKHSDDIAQELQSIWNMFAQPRHPLKRQFLQPLDEHKVAELISKLPNKSREDSDRNDSDVSALWTPLSTVPLPRSHKSVARTPLPRDVRDFMLYEILKETRLTQMQIPLAVVEEFFGIDRDEPANVQVSIISENRLSQPITRPVVISQGEEGTRLMRRIEMPTIRHLSRPLIAAFIKLPEPQSFAYKLFPQRTAAHRKADELLNAYGQQGNARRRYYLGDVDDEVWPQLKGMIL